MIGEVPLLLALFAAGRTALPAERAPAGAGIERSAAGDLPIELGEPSIELLTPSSSSAFEADAPPATFTWAATGLDVFRVEFSTTPEFERPIVPRKAFELGTSYTPAVRDWRRLMLRSECGRASLFWRVVGRPLHSRERVVSGQTFTLWFLLDGQGSVRISYSPPDLPVTGEYIVGYSSPQCPITKLRIDFDGDGIWDDSRSPNKDAFEDVRFACVQDRGDLCVEHGWIRIHGHPSSNPMSSRFRLPSEPLRATSKPTPSLADSS